MRENKPADRDIVATPTPPVVLGSNAREGLAALLRAYTYAKDAAVDPWDFALEIEYLFESGLTVSDLRWLAAKKLAAHGREISDCGDPHRSFEGGGGLKFDSRTCLSLTEEGIAFAASFLGAEVPGGTESGVRVNAACGGANSVGALLGGVVKPRWHGARRELYLGEQLVKRFRVPARNQEWILEVFEEDGWPETIDDPLPPSPNIDPKSRLHDTINRLNNKQINPLLRFHGNGNGCGVFWKLVG